MNLAEAFKEAPVKDLGPACSVAAIIKSLPPDDADALRAAIADDRWRSTDITRVLADEGIHVGAHAMARHRRGGCKCARLGEP